MEIFNVVTGELVGTSSAKSLKNQITSVGSTAVPLPAVALSNRKQIIVQLLGTNPVYLGASDVTASGAHRGIVLANQYDSLSFDLTTTCILYGITASGSSDVAVMESI